MYCFLFVSILSTCTTEDKEQPEFMKQILKCNYIGHAIKFTADNKYTFSIQQMDKIIQIENPDESPAPDNNEVPII